MTQDYRVEKADVRTVAVRRWRNMMGWRDEIVIKRMKGTRCVSLSGPGESVPIKELMEALKTLEKW